MKKLVFLMAIVMTACSTPSKKGGEAATAFIDETVITATVDRSDANSPRGQPLLEKGVSMPRSLGVKMMAQLRNSTDFAAENIYPILQSQVVFLRSAITRVTQRI